MTNAKEKTPMKAATSIGAKHKSVKYVVIVYHDKRKKFNYKLYLLLHQFVIGTLITALIYGLPGKCGIGETILGMVLMPVLISIFLYMASNEIINAIEGRKS